MGHGHERTLDNSSQAWRALRTDESRFVRRRAWLGLLKSAIGAVVLYCLVLAVAFDSLFHRTTPVNSILAIVFATVILFASRRGLALDDFRPVCFVVEEKRIDRLPVDVGTRVALAIFTAGEAGDRRCLVSRSGSEIAPCAGDFWQAVREGRGYRVLQNRRTGEWQCDFACEFLPSEFAAIPEEAFA